MRDEGILLICDKGCAGREFETPVGEYGITTLRPSRKDEKARYGEPLLKKVRQLIESVDDTLKGQLDLEDQRTLVSGCRDPRRPARVGDGHRDLAQPHHRRTRHPVTDRLRPLTDPRIRRAC
ncbi:hypothetical protein OG405_04260 [Nocardia sp. NBC_01329]|nr:hypothetical protein OG405_04260 [Nocardia sp. NBC_01329]